MFSLGQKKQKKGSAFLAFFLMNYIGFYNITETFTQKKNWISMDGLLDGRMDIAFYRSVIGWIKTAKSDMIDFKLFITSIVTRIYHKIHMNTRF